MRNLLPYSLSVLLFATFSTAFAEETALWRTTNISAPGGETRIGRDHNGYLIIAFRDSTNQEVKLWVDDGASGGTAGDGVPNGSELRTIDSAGDVGWTLSLAADSSGNLAISYYDSTNQDLKLWVDDGSSGGTAGDGTANGAEIRTIDSAGDVGFFTSLALSRSGHLVISYADFTNADLKLWVDDGASGGTAGDGIANGAEVRTIDNTGNGGFYSSLGLARDGSLAVSYFDNTNGDLKLWVDDGAGGGTAGDGLANGSEIQTIDEAGTVGRYPSLELDRSGRLAVSYYDSGNGDLKLWVDDGVSGGTAGDGLAQASEIRTLDAVDDTGLYPSLTLDSTGNLTVSYYDGTNGNLRLWVDDGISGGTAQDGIANGGEIRSIDSSGDVGRYISSVLDDTGSLAISYCDSTNNQVKLARFSTYEVRTIDSTGLTGWYTSLALDSSRTLAVAYYASTNADFKLWVDDGAGSGGIAGDGLANGFEVRNIDTAGSVGTYGSLGLSSGGRLAASYYDGTNEDLKLWVDDGAGGGIAGDAAANGGEIRIIDSPGIVGYDTSLALDSAGRLAVSYFDVSNSALKLWVDDGAGGGTAGDAIANGSEIRTIDNGGDVGQYTSVALDNAGRLAVSYYDATNGDLKLWVDDGNSGGIAGDGAANGSEIRIIDSSGMVGEQSSLTLDSNGQLATSYYDATNSDLKLWVDDGAGGGTAGDNAANGGEVRVIDSAGSVGWYPSLNIDSSGHLAISYHDATNSDLKLWVDDGTDGGAAGDGEANGAEVRTIDSLGSIGLYSSLDRDSSGEIAISYYASTGGDLRLFTAQKAAEIGVLGNGTAINDGDATPSAADHTDFGEATTVSGTVLRTFTIENSGTNLLQLGPQAVSLSGANAEDFSITVEPGVFVAPGAATTVTIRFAPSAAGLRTALVTVSNSDLNESPYTFAIQGTGNAAPVISEGASASVNMSEDGVPTPFTLTLNAADGENDEITWSILTQGTLGSASVSETGTSKQVVYTPAENVSGTDSFVVQVSDGFGGTDTITVTVNISAVNDAPVIAEGAAAAAGMSEDGSPIAFNLTLHAADAENDALTWSIWEQPLHGTASASGTGNSKAIGYMPAADYNGTDSFIVRVSDGNGGSDAITVNVTLGAVNDAPVITEGAATSVTMSENGSPTPFSLTLHANDADNDQLTWGITAVPLHGTASAGGTGAGKQVAYTPANGFIGNDAFTVSVSDGQGGVDAIVVNVNVLEGTDEPAPDWDHDGIPDSVDPDDDNDGVEDSQELTDGTDPRDTGDSVQRIAHATCLDWNSHAAWNILETVNKSNAAVSLVIEVFACTGEVIGSTQYSLAANTQFDYPLNELLLGRPNSYGQVCITHNGNPGDVDGRLVKYSDPAGTTDASDFAAVSPMTNGRRGVQFFHYNTYQPSLDPVEAGHFVANYVELSNPGGSPAVGRLKLYNQQGETIADESIELPAHGRRDIAVHERTGQTQVGLGSWVPESGEETFVVRLSRYFYPRSIPSGEIKRSLETEAFAGTGARLMFPLNTVGASTVIEIGNVLNTEVSAEVRVYSAEGELREARQIWLAAHGTFHYVMDSVLGLQQRGTVTVQGTLPESMLAHGVTYGRSAQSGVNSISGDYLRPALGQTISGSYNTFLNQAAELLVVNPTDTARTAAFSMVRSDSPSGSNRQIVADQPFTVPEHGVYRIDLNSVEQPDHYGLITVVPGSANTLAAWTRRGKSGEFAILSPLRE